MHQINLKGSKDNGIGNAPTKQPDRITLKLVNKPPHTLRTSEKSFKTHIEMIHLECMVWRGGLPSSIIKGPSVLEEVGKDWPPFSREPPGGARGPSGRLGALPVGGARTRPAAARPALSGRRGSNQRDGGSRPDAQRRSFRAEPGARGRPRSPATLAALGAEDAREGGMLPAGQTGEGPATPVRRPRWPGEGTLVARGGGTVPTWGDGFREAALAAGLRTWFAWPGGAGPCHLVRWHSPPGEGAPLRRCDGPSR